MPPSSKQASKHASKLALVLSGGGARGAYEAGVIHYIRSALTAREGGVRPFDVQCGSSVGAINTCLMASLADNPKEQGKRLNHLWENLDQDQIYTRNFKALTSFLARTARGLSSNLVSFNPFNPLNRKNEGVHFKAFLDTAPLPQFLNSKMDFSNIGKNIRKGALSAVSLTATNVSTGKMELFIQKKANLDYTGEYEHHMTELTASHAIASAAIPLIFPPVFIGENYYVDGGLRLNTPLSPAIQLGANRILIIGLHYLQKPNEKVAHVIKTGEPPTMGQLTGLVMNALFLDRIQYDIEQLTRINRMVEWSEKVYGKDYLGKINSMLAREGIRGDIANRGLKRIKVLEISPSQDISQIFLDCYHDPDTKNTFTAFEKMLLRVLDIDPTAGVDILSYLGFIPNYIRRLLELGFEDAAANHDKLVAFLTEQD